LRVRPVRLVGAALLWLTVAVCLAVTIVPRFLDRIYYRGPVTSHFNGARFVNPDREDTTAPPGGRSRGSFLLAQATGSDGRPPWPASVAVAQTKPAARIEGQRMVATWVGHATVLVQTQGLNILTDPILSDVAGPFGIGPTRVARPGIAFDDLPTIDLVVVSHNHYDHMDLPTLKRLWARDRPLIVTSLGNDSVIRQAGVPARALDWGGRMRVRPGIDVVVNRNHHWSSRWFTDRNRALWSSFVVTLPGGNLFFAGDTGFGDGGWADTAAALGPVRLALIPIGAFRFAPGQMGTGSHLGPVDAAEVFRRLGAARAIPIHWGTFRLSYEAYDTPPKLLAAAMDCSLISHNRPDKRFAAVPIGRLVEIPPIAPVVLPSAVFAMPDRGRDEIRRCLDTPAVRAMR
jgi:L-ascorbate metabolism protein UlaG (beta-lactamase superfamily)